MNISNNDEKSVWLDGARHGTEVGLDLAIKILTEFRDSIRKKLDGAKETEGEHE
jgi:hypothetical protein